MLKCTINGKEVEVKEGSTIIEAFHHEHASIAHYCWHPGLSVAGVCRLCVVEIEGNPRPQIACNTAVTNGMVINNTSEKVKDAVKWGMDFHLINHPLDCPICDQAGECGLQEQYMAYGKYDPEMAERKVKKRKVLDLGPRVVLDSERCILCSRCVRFCDEVTKTSELGIFNRGDRSEIGTFEDKPLNNKYSANTIDICPVGALTSKDFRFRQRVWFLKEAKTICTGCSTGCNVTAFYNKEGVFRIKPIYNEEVNGHWMCDEGRDVYKHVNVPARLLDAVVKHNGKSEYLTAVEAAKHLGEELKKIAAQGDIKQVALVLTAQYSVEEFEALIGFFKGLGVEKIYHWINNPDSFDSFDGLLLRGDRNPNTKGLLEVLTKYGIQTRWNDLEEALKSGGVRTVVVAGPENQAVFPDMKGKVTELARAEKLIWLTASKSEYLDGLSGDITQIPLKTYLEKDGTYVNHKGLRQKVKRGLTIVAGALTLEEVVTLMKGQSLDLNQRPEAVGGRIYNEFTLQRGTL